MRIDKNISLKPYNSFGIDVPAQYFTVMDDAAQLPELTDMPHEKHILGGGSNILLTQPVAGLVVQNQLKGMAVEQEDKNHVWLRVAAGEVWHELVLHAINNGWGGLENLALIPGTAGAAPIQNIGAYGAEAKDTIESVSFWYWKEKRLLAYNNRECNFGYRDSIFKHLLKDKVFITSVVFKLSKQPQYNISYGAIAQELEIMGVHEPTLKAVAFAVMSIRRSKLPDPKTIGNAGSFFKNPTLALLKFEEIRSQYPKIPSYKVSDTLVKVPAAWLIEQCGWKGYKKGDIGVHQKQALVLVNYGNGSGNEIRGLAVDIIKSVRQRFGVELETEVQLW